eukprot:CAMPEP_0203933502 /NCGR_PEP_ID=MMETSP0359-20131031/71665_1 /ASSEMBLY_ACC=CAM_ASM_000338 /TAXON_ID=268821 /ORGANISM="Scrippsiella Hangoei, Strain SHTV-5" /LENGTH=173 /DNA_ID=CAMNT_0050863091 /DNA_START=448 /DNA_END=966 /DNA_ORIENTATION=+
MLSKSWVTTTGISASTPCKEFAQALALSNTFGMSANTTMHAGLEPFGCVVNTSMQGFTSRQLTNNTKGDVALRVRSSQIESLAAFRKQIVVPPNPNAASVIDCCVDMFSSLWQRSSHQTSNHDEQPAGDIGASSRAEAEHEERGDPDLALPPAMQAAIDTQTMALSDGGGSAR